MGDADGRRQRVRDRTSLDAVSPLIILSSFCYWRCAGTRGASLLCLSLLSPLFHRHVTPSKRLLARPHPFAPGVVPGGGGERENRSSKLRSPSADRAPSAAAASLPDAPPLLSVPPDATTSTFPGEAPVAPTPRGGACGVTPSRGERFPELLRRPPPLWPFRNDFGDDLPLLGL